jgi:hypothetical protein
MLHPMAPGVTVLGLVATAHQAALQACAQMNPRVTHGEAPIADVGHRLGGW